jgi:hypothetical protein
MRLKILVVLPQPSKLRALELLPDALRVTKAESDFAAEEEGYDGYVCGSDVVADRELLVRREKGLDLLGAGEELGCGCTGDGVRMELARVLVAHGIDEEPGLGALDRVGGENSRLREEVGDELDENAE